MRGNKKEKKIAGLETGDSTVETNLVSTVDLGSWGK